MVTRFFTCFRLDIFFPDTLVKQLAKLLYF